MRGLQGEGSGPDPFAPPPAFPPPGVPGQTSPSQTTTNPTSTASNPSTTAPGLASTTPNPLNPFNLDPALLQQMFGGGPGGPGGGLGGGLGGLGDLGALGAFGSPPAPADTRPPEERFQMQLQVCLLSLSSAQVFDYLSQQLQDMGFTNAAQNVRALLATGGNVHSAIEYILNGGGL